METIIFGEPLLNYIYALGVFAAFVLVFKGFKYFILIRLRKTAERTENDIDDTIIKVIDNIKPLFYYYVAFYIAVIPLDLSNLILKILGVVLTIAIVYQAAAIVQVLVDYILEKNITKNEDDEKEVDFAISVIGGVTKFILWVIALLMILSNLGINITSLIAGLGIGGIAIAFALQSILEDLFSSFTIFFDKPFKVGDFIKVGSDMGTVEKVGIKTTRIRTTQGEELVVSNKELTSTRIQNFKRMEERRGVFSFGVTYETPTAKLRQIPVSVRKIIESIPNVRFDRAHFNKFDDSALTYEVVFYINSKEYGDFMDAQQEINLKIMEKFEQEGIEMAYPTRMVYTKSVN